MVNVIPRPEYPRPQFRRPDWQNLNGTWAFEIDAGRSGRARGLPGAETLSGRITVPFCPESKLSGVENRDFCPAVWYARRVDIPKDKLSGRVLLHFGACDYLTEVFCNGVSVGTHRGGYSSFAFDITHAVTPGENRITVCAEDDVRSGLQPGGKQSSLYASHGCDYTRTTGIWQTVWLEFVPEGYLTGAKMTPDAANCALDLEVTARGLSGQVLTAEASFAGKPCGRAEARVTGDAVRLHLPLSEEHLWAPGHPALYDLVLSCGEDRVESYFGLRSVEFRKGCLYLNGEPLFQRLVLDQGFYPDGVYTAPSDEELEADVRRSMDMGFNGARLHQKVFEPRFLYHCDRLGYLVWGEHANWQMDAARPEAWRGFLPEWLEILQRDYSHPAIIGWCPLNETQWNIDPLFVKMLRDMTHAYDPGRAFIDGSGWVHVPDCTDICDFHDYEQDPEKFREMLAPLAEGRAIPIHTVERGRIVRPKTPNAVPTFCSEYGGIWWNPDSTDGWGYGSRVQSEEEFRARFKGLTDALLDNPGISALCYTQLTDVEQEQNGLYTFDRRPKFDPAFFREVLSRKAAAEK